MSDRLIDILDDKKKVGTMNENYHYRQSVIPRLEKLRKLIATQPSTIETDKDYGVVHDLIYDLEDNPHHRLRPLEMKKCNELWKEYR